MATSLSLAEKCEMVRNHPNFREEMQWQKNPVWLAKKIGLIREDLPLEDVQVRVDQFYRQVKKFTGIHGRNCPDEPTHPLCMRIFRIPSCLRSCYLIHSSVFSNDHSPLYAYRNMMPKAVAGHPFTFMHAVKNQDVSLVEELIKAGAQVNEYALDIAIHLKCYPLVLLFLKSIRPDEWHRCLAEKCPSGVIQRAIEEAPSLEGKEKQDRQKEIDFAFKYEQLVNQGPDQEEARTAMDREWPLNFRGFLRHSPKKAIEMLRGRVVDLNTATAALRFGILFDMNLLFKGGLTFDSEVFSLMVSQNDHWGPDFLKSAIASVRDPERVREVFYSQVIVDENILSDAMISGVSREIGAVLFAEGVKTRNFNEAIYVGDHEFVRTEVDKIVRSQRGLEAEDAASAKDAEKGEGIWLYRGIELRPVQCALSVLRTDTMTFEERRAHIRRLMTVTTPGVVSLGDLYTAFKMDPVCFSLLFSRFQVPKSVQEQREMICSIIRSGNINFLETSFRFMNLKLKNPFRIGNLFSGNKCQSYLNAAIRSQKEEMMEYVIGAGIGLCKCGELNCAMTQEEAGKARMDWIKQLIKAKKAL
jgi:hypothetical protein